MYLQHTSVFKMAICNKNLIYVYNVSEQPVNVLQLYINEQMLIIVFYIIFELKFHHKKGFIRRGYLCTYLTTHGPEMLELTLKPYLYQPVSTYY